MIKIRMNRILSLPFDRGEVIAIRADLARQLVAVGSASFVEPEMAVTGPPETREAKPRRGRPKKKDDED